MPNPATPVNRFRAALVALSTVGIVACTPSATDPTGMTDVVITARLAPGGASAVPCATPQEFVQDLANVSARVDVVSVSEGGIFEQIGLDVRQAGAPDIVQLLGDVSFPVLSGRGPFLVGVALGYQGDDVEGQFSGSLELESGIAIVIESLTIPALTPQTDGTLMTTNAVLCVSSDAVEQGRTFCTTETDIDSQNLVYDPQANRFRYSYRRRNIDWLEQGFRTAIFELDGSLDPADIYRGSTQVTGGLGQLADLQIDVQPVTDGGPGALGEGISGDVTLRFEDGRPPTEGGSFALARTQRLACDPLETLAARR